MKELKLNSFPEAIKINKNTGLFQNQEHILLCLKNKIEIPILHNYHLNSREELEKKASNLAYFLNVPIKEI